MSWEGSSLGSLFEQVRPSPFLFLGLQVCKEERHNIMRTIGQWFSADLARIGFLVSLIPAGLIAGNCLVDSWYVRPMAFLLFVGFSLTVGIISDWYIHLILGNWFGYIVIACLLVITAGYFLAVAAGIPIRERWLEYFYRLNMGIGKRKKG